MEAIVLVGRPLEVDCVGEVEVGKPAWFVGKAELAGVVVWLLLEPVEGRVVGELDEEEHDAKSEVNPTSTKAVISAHKKLVRERELLIVFISN